MGFDDQLTADPSAGTPEEPASRLAQLFRWQCNESGEIDWVEGVPRGALIGRPIVHAGSEGQVDWGVARAFAARAPFHEGRLEIAGGAAVRGTWKISGVPEFDPATGRFAGYRGIAQRCDEPVAECCGSPGVDPDLLRELAHELKTPLNAIIGFAEIITGEYLGPAEDRYRERAGKIVAQARLLQTAVDDLDFAAKLRSDGGDSSADLSECVGRAWDEIKRRAQICAIAVNFVSSAAPALCALNDQLTQRLIERVGAAVIGYASAGELLTFRVKTDAERSTLSIDCPQSLRGIDLRPERNRRASDTATLPLRLVMGLARAAGGELELNGDQLLLHLPKVKLAPGSRETYLESGGACSSMVEPAAHNG